MDRFAKLAIVCGLIATFWSIEAFAEQPVNFVLDSAIAGPVPEAAGQWRTKTQSVFDPAVRNLTQRSYSVWDPTPSRDFDFTWQPDDPKGDKAGRINGSGRLVWRSRSKAAYDPTSVMAEYQGPMRDGRMEGQGTYIDSTGLKCEGQWRRGLMDGPGTLRLPSGGEYSGQFAKGRAHGDGRLFDITGEIFDGRFVDGWRHGRGTTTLPNGSSYASFWIEGKESERSRLVRIAQSGSGSVSNPPDDVRIGIAVDKRLPPQVNGSEQALWYEAVNSAAGLQIRPANSRLLKMWKEKAPLQLAFSEEDQLDGASGILSQTRKQFVPLNLRVELQNRSSSPIQMTGLYLDVKNSAFETKPAIQVVVGTTDGCVPTGTYSSGFTLQNFGWRTAEAVTLKLNAANLQGGSGALSISKKLGDLDKTLRVDIESDLKAMGVDTDYLKGLEEGFVCESKTPGKCLTSLRSTGKLGRLANNVQMQDSGFVLKFASVLEYSWHDVKGDVQNWSHPFTATLPLGVLKQAQECGGLESPQVITTKTQQFKLDTMAYRIPISYPATIGPSRTIPLIFAIEAPKSSSHDFTVVIQLADGREIRSLPIGLLYYRPSWFIGEAPDASGDDTGDDDADGRTLNKTGLNGADLRLIQDADEKKCSAACDADSKCVGFTRDSWSRLCSLKSQVVSRRSDPRVSSSLKKGIKRPVASGDPEVFERYKNQKFEGHAFLAGLNSSVDECEQSCKTEQTCSSYNFVTATKVCFLIDFGMSKPLSNSATSSGVKFQPAQ